MRVVAGQLRSRKLCAPAGALTRPTHDRVKEALFSVLGDIRDTNVADLYAGTGALGIEALSRGARHACFVERAKAALECLRRNLQSLQLTDQSTVLARPVESSGPELLRLGPFDLMFCDPPWTNLEQVIAHLSHSFAHRWLHPEGILVLEHPAKADPDRMAISNLIAIDGRSWGDTAVTFYRASPASANDHRAEQSTSLNRQV